MRRYCLLLLFLLIGCSGQPEVVEVTPSAVQVFVGSDDFYVGQPRIPFLLYDGVEAATNLQAVTVEVLDLAQEPFESVWMGSATEYADYEVPYWTIYPDIPHAGEWGLVIETTTADGITETYQRRIAVNDTPNSPAIGVAPPASTNRTSTTHDVSQLTSGNQPDPALYDTTVADALTSGQPTVVMFATPAFCQTQFCAPVVRSLEAVQEQVGEQANLIHLEIYQDFQELILADEVEEWGLTSEPWTFVIDSDGEVVARMGGPVSPVELLEQLEPLLDS